MIRTPAVPPPEAKESAPLRGIFHVHSEYSHDSKMPLDLVIKTARLAALDFVVVTDHNNLSAAGEYGGRRRPKRPLLIFGDEISTWKDGHLVAIGIKEKPPDIEDTQEIVNSIHKQGGYAIPAHPFSPKKPWVNWAVENFDGLEVFCFSDIFYSEIRTTLVPKAIVLTPRQFLKSTLKTPEAALRLWDERLARGRRIPAFASTDAHLKWRWGNLVIENLLLYVQSVTMYVLTDELRSEKIIGALAQGRSFIAFEVRGVAQDFSFTARTENRTYAAGDSVPLRKSGRALLTVQVPDSADIRLIHDGKLIKRNEGKILEQEITEPGAWRAEVYRDGGIWILSNPIYAENKEL